MCERVVFCVLKCSVMNRRVTPMNCQRQKSFVQREGRWLLFWEFQQKATRLENLTFHDLQNCQKNPEGGGHVFLHVLFTQQSHVEGVFSFVLPDGQTCFFFCLCCLCFTWKFCWYLSIPWIYSPPSMQSWQMKVYSGIPKPKNAVSS